MAGLKSVKKFKKVGCLKYGMFWLLSECQGGTVCLDGIFRKFIGGIKRPFLNKLIGKLNTILNVKINRLRSFPYLSKEILA